MNNQDKIIQKYIPKATAELMRILKCGPKKKRPLCIENNYEFLVFEDEEYVQKNHINVLLDIHRQEVCSPRSGKPLLHRHTFFEMFYVYQGSCECYFEGCKYTFTQNQFCLMNTNTLHTMHVKKNSYIFNILVSTQLFDEAFVQLIDENDPFLSFFLDSIYNKKTRLNFMLLTSSRRVIASFM